MHAHDPDHHRPVDPGHRPDTVLTRLHGKAAGRSCIIGASGVVHSRTAKFQFVRAGIVPREGIEVRIGVDVPFGSLHGFADRFVVNALTVAGGG